MVHASLETDQDEALSQLVQALDWGVPEGEGLFHPRERSRTRGGFQRSALERPPGTKHGLSRKVLTEGALAMESQARLRVLP